MCINQYQSKYCIVSPNVTILISKDKYYIINNCIFLSNFGVSTSCSDFESYMEENMDEEEAMYYGLANLIGISDDAFEHLSDEEQNIVRPLYNDNEYETILVCNYDKKIND